MTDVPVGRPTPEPADARDRTLGRRFSSNAAWVFAAIVVYSGSQWALLVLLGRLGSPELLGTYSLGVAIATPVFALLAQHVRAAYVADVVGEWDFSVYLSLSALTAVAAFFVVIALGASFGHAGSLGLIAVAAGMRGTEAIADTVHGVEHKLERLRSVSISRMGKGLVSLVIFPLGLWTTGSPVAAILMILAFWWIVFWVYDLRRARLSVLVSPKIDVQRIAPLAARLWPIGAAEGLLALSSQLPIYMLDHVQGARAVGYFAAVFSVIYFGRPVTQSLATVSSPRLAKLFRVDLAGFSRLLGRTVSICLAFQVLILVAVLFGGRYFLLVAYGPEFEGLGTELIVISAVGVILALGTVFSQALIAIGRYVQQFRVHVLMLVVASLASWFLIPKYGINGAIASLGLANVARVGVLFWVLTGEIRRGRMIQKPQEPAFGVEP